MENCTNYDPITGRCLNCATNFFLVDNLCIRLPDNCIEVDRTGACTRCRSGYSSLNGNCVRINKDPNCLIEIGETGKCSQCIENYYVNIDSTCSPNPPNCVKARSDGYCLQCKSGYKANLFTGICEYVEPPQNCQEY